MPIRFGRHGRGVGHEIALGTAGLAGLLGLEGRKIAFAQPAIQFCLIKQAGLVFRLDVLIVVHF